MPTSKTWKQKLPTRDQYLYSGYRFLVKDTFYVLALITYETAFLTSPFTVVYGIVDGTLTVVTDTLFAPFTYLADVHRQAQIDKLPDHEVVPVQPFQPNDIAPIKDKNAEGSPTKEKNLEDDESSLRDLEKSGETLKDK